MKTNVPKPVPPAYMAQQPVGAAGPTSNTAQPSAGFSSAPNPGAMQQAPTRKRSLIGGAA